MDGTAKVDGTVKGGWHRKGWVAPGEHSQIPWRHYFNPNNTQHQVSRHPFSTGCQVRCLHVERTRIACPVPPTFAGATHRGFDRVPGTSFGHVGQVASMAAALDSFRFIRQVDTEAVSSERIPSVGGSEEPFTGQWAVWEGNHAMALLPAVEALAQEQCRKCWVLTHSQTASAVNLWKSRLV